MKNWLNVFVKPDRSTGTSQILYEFIDLFRATWKHSRASGFAILSRELTEIASRRRTHVIRTLFAAGLLGLIFWSESSYLERFETGSFSILGSGRDLFGMLVGWLVGTVFFVMPILTCGTIIAEKERNTLSLLLTTHLAPGAIVLQKMLTRVYLMATLLLVTLPLMAFAYSLGGVSSDIMVCAIAGLLAMIMMTGSLSMMWSVRASSTLGAVGGTFISQLSFGVFGMFIMPFMFLFIAGPGGGGWFWALVFAAGILVFALVVSFIMLALAASWLPASALEPPRNRLMEFFGGVDTIFSDLNKVVGGIVVVKDRPVLPGDRPLVWRERYKRALGKTHYLVRIVMLIELPTVCIILAALSFQTRGSTQLSGLVYFLWLIAIAVIIVRTVGIFPTERTRETLDVLLSTPLTGRDILLESMSGVRRTMIAVAIPLLTVYGSVFMMQPSGESRMLYIGAGLACTWLYLSGAAWLSMLLGLRCRTQFRAAGFALLITFCWVLLPVIVFGSTAFQSNDADFFLYREGLISVFPSYMIIALEACLRGPPFGLVEAPVAFILITLLVQTATLFGLRHWCLINADDWLGRCEISRDNWELNA